VKEEPWTFCKTQIRADSDLYPHLQSLLVLGALYNQVSGALVYGPLFGQVWLDAMNKVSTHDSILSPFLSSKAKRRRQSGDITINKLSFLFTWFLGQGRRRLDGRLSTKGPNARLIAQGVCSQPWKGMGIIP